MEQQRVFYSKFLEFMEECGALLFGDFTLKSGRKSPYFINTGEYSLGSQLGRLSEFYAEMITRSINEGNAAKFDVLYGPAYKGISLAVTAAVALSRNVRNPMDVRVSYNRKEAKDHGDAKSILGYTPTKADKIAIIEDVTTAGTSIRETIALFEGLGIANPAENITSLYISVDRMERGTDSISATKQIERDYGIPVYSIATAHDIIDYLESHKKSDYAAKMREYLNEYGV
ncbi:MAG: orotate phosphoribosyltransferase [Oscillospiraceae bacterium]|nr:orotate phosphoribosyltransferase [Oscillospiraceae bacterium]